MSGHVAAIIAAAGSGVRFGADIPKALIQIQLKPKKKR